MIKKIIKKVIGKYNFKRISYARNLYRKLKCENKNLSLFDCIKKVKIIHEKENKAEEIKELLQKIDLEELEKKDNFYYSIDKFKTLYSNKYIIGNLTIDYSNILINSLNDYKINIESNYKDKEFCESELSVISGLEDYIDRIVNFITTDEKSNEIIVNLQNIKDKSAEGFKEALQRILFYNQILWQTGHYLNGLGRLDLILYKYYKQDVDNKKLTKEGAKELLREFLEKSHKEYYFKSNSLMGDTGQIIIIGGKNEKGEYECNDLSYLFIELMEELKLPDPKVLVRVSKNMPRKLMEQSLSCIKTGIGCPLFANDDVIIPKLIEFGYDEEDAYSYCTSACWEPYICSKSLDQNNMKPIVFLEPFHRMLESEDIESIKNEETLLEKFKMYLEDYIKEIIDELNSVEAEEDLVLTLFTDNCIKNNKDISKGGAKYNHNGFTGVGLANLVNSIININEIIFKEKVLSFVEFNEIRKNNFNNQEDLVKKLKNIKSKYGTDSEKVINLSNKIIKMTSNAMLKYDNQFKGKYKFGLSAPSYIDQGKLLGASFDGRKEGEPLAVHISSDSINGYTELIQFASKLDYGDNRFNGNVVDFFVSPNFINDNFEKFVDFLMLSISVGFFEMQMNVVSSETLIEARKNPDKFPNLIVRVWGFSAYYKDLPDDYKDYLIERALKSENNSL